jgi:hypothetical protein
MKEQIERIFQPIVIDLDPDREQDRIMKLVPEPIVIHEFP